LEFKLSLFNNALIQKQAVSEIIKCNDVTSRFGLALTENQAKALVQTRTTALNENGRIEFGSGIINKIIYEFCDSPYISERNYEKTLHELIEIFYYYKNETLDLISDEDLIKYMKKAFDGVCKGSLELLSGRELYNLAHNLRCGYPIDYTDNPNNDDKEDEDEEY
jgi:hypothetical protein